VLELVECDVFIDVTFDLEGHRLIVWNHLESWDFNAFFIFATVSADCGLLDNSF
jgi:hypothetical protein